MQCVNLFFILGSVHFESFQRVFGHPIGKSCIRQGEGILSSIKSAPLRSKISK